MPLNHSNGSYFYEPQLGILHFQMHDGEHIVHCMVSDIALRNRAEVSGLPQEKVDELFEVYRSEVEALAARQYDRGAQSPIVRVADLTPPPPLPARKKP